MTKQDELFMKIMMQINDALILFVNVNLIHKKIISIQ